MNWLIVAAVMATFYLGAYLIGLFRKRWTWPALLVATAHLPLALLVSVAPVRGWADPGYAGFSMGLLRVPAGPGVTVVAGTIFVLSVFAIWVALNNQRGMSMRIVSLFDFAVAGNFLVAGIMTLVENPASMRIELGEYLTLGPAPALLIEFGLLVLPLLLCAVWAWRRSALVQSATIKESESFSPNV